MFDRFHYKIGWVISLGPARGTAPAADTRIHARSGHTYSCPQRTHLFMPAADARIHARGWMHAFALIPPVVRQPRQLGVGGVFTHQGCGRPEVEDQQGFGERRLKVPLQQRHHRASPTLGYQGHALRPLVCRARLGLCLQRGGNQGYVYGLSLQRPLECEARQLQGAHEHGAAHKLEVYQRRRAPHAGGSLCRRSTLGHQRNGLGTRMVRLGRCVWPQRRHHPEGAQPRQRQPWP